MSGIGSSSADVDDRGLVLRGSATVDVEAGRGLDKVGELGVAIGPGVEVGALSGDDVADAGQGRPAVLVGDGLDGLVEQCMQSGVVLR
jgi:hypothetical protein